ncbi:MAG: DUF6931 family protein [bacterium]
MATQNPTHQSLERLLRESPTLVHARISDHTKARLASAKQVNWASFKESLADHPAELVEIIAQILPLRQAIFWGLVCGEACPTFGQGGTAADSVRNCLRWAMNPQESLRKMAARHADSLPWKTAEGLLARAVAWSEGSIMPPHVPVFVPAPAGVTGHFVAGAVLTIASMIDATVYNSILHSFIAIAEQIAGDQLLPAGWYLHQVADHSLISPIPSTSFDTFPGIGDHFI